MTIWRANRGVEGLSPESVMCVRERWPYALPRYSDFHDETKRPLLLTMATNHEGTDQPKRRPWPARGEKGKMNRYVSLACLDLLRCADHSPSFGPKQTIIITGGSFHKLLLVFPFPCTSEVTCAATTGACAFIVTNVLGPGASQQSPYAK